MTRPDLRLGYEGWQASDPTPQETSDGRDSQFNKINKHLFILRNGYKPGFLEFEAGIHPEWDSGPPCSTMHTPCSYI